MVDEQIDLPDVSHPRLLRKRRGKAPQACRDDVLLEPGSAPILDDHAKPQSVITDIIISARTRAELVDSLHQIIGDIERESDHVTHFGGHHGRPGSYSVSIATVDEPPNDNL